MYRKQFIGRMAAAVVTGYCAFLLPGCNVYSDIENWITVAIASLNSIVLVLSTNGITAAPTIVNAVLGALNAVKAAIIEYQSTTPAPVGAIAKIETALKDATDQFVAFLRSISQTAGSGLFGLVSGLVQIILSTIAGFLNKLPVVATPQTVAHISTGLAQAAQLMGTQVIPVHRTIRAFKKDYNAVLDTAPSHDVLVPTAAYHKLSIWERL